ncbi:MAG TPA: hypothetical protein VF843_16680 [Streptosporangiaceae bacterium]
MPDNVRELFPPVLAARTAGPGRDAHPAAATRLAPAAASRAAQGRLSEPEPVPASSPQPAGTHRGRFLGSYRRQVAWMTVLTVLLLATAAGTTVALMRRSPAGAAQGSSQAGRPGSGGAAIDRAAAVRAAAAQWVAADVSRSSIIACDTMMCSALVKAGVASSDLLPLTATAPDPLGAGVLVTTRALRAQFRGRLESEYAPAVLASFGTGPDQIAVRVIAADGAAAYRTALGRDVAARDVLGTQLIGNGKVVLPAQAKNELAAGQVDPRLLITLPALAYEHPVRVLGFYGRAPGASSGVPFTGARLAGFDPRAGLAPKAYLRWMLAFLRSQRSVYRAASLTTTSSHGQTVVLVRFALPNPIGLLH